MEDLFEMNETSFSPMDDIMNCQTGMEGLGECTLGSMFSKVSSNPFDSGFDADHPMPTYDQLRNAGFSDYLARNILSGDSHTYSQKELFHCLYESDDPLKAYNEMMDAKVQGAIEKADKLIHDTESMLFNLNLNPL